MSSGIKKLFSYIVFVIIIFFFGLNGRGLQSNPLNNNTYWLLQSSLMYSYLMMNSPVWMMVAMQNPFVDSNSEPDSLDYTKSLLEKNYLNRLTKNHPKTNSNYKYLKNDYSLEVEVDSSAEYVTPRMTLDSFVIGYPYSMDLDDYLSIRKRKIQNDIWDSLLARYDLREALTGGDLARLISQSTGLTIPVPPNPVIGLFGKPQISINVSGEVNLKVGWRWDSQNLGTVSAFGQTQSTPVFSQDIRVNVSASIGDKLNLKTDWNTRRQFEYDNKFKIGYDGESDEIIKKIEVGNVTLPIPSSLIGGGQALFGVRADFQFGPLYLKTIFSQRRGERKFVNVRGGASTQPFQIRAYDFATNHFFVDTIYKQIYKEYFKHSTPIAPSSPLAKEKRVTGIEVWESVNNIKEGAVSAVAVAHTDIHAIMPMSRNLPPGMDKIYADSMKNKPIQAGIVERGNFLKLDSNRFRFDYNLGTLHILNLRPDRFYAVGYKIENTEQSPEDDLYYGTFSTDVREKDTLVLKLIYRPNMQPGFERLWDRQMKNIYSINASYVDINNTKIGIWYINQNNDSTDVLAGAPDKLVTILGVDQVTNATGAAPADGQFDLREPFFNAQYGEITFPSLRPFDSAFADYFKKIGTPELAEQYTFSEIYDTTYDIARLNTSRDRFVITGEVTGRSTNRINLGAYNLAPNSVKVTLDGVPLREFEDYVIDYYAGQLTLRNPRASLPNANLKIEYEQRDIFNISTRTLTGIRGDYELIKNRKIDSKLGFTIMNYDQSALIDRVRLGEEPISNTMIGFDANLNWQTPWMTKMLDFLPFYDTKAKSSLQLRGEWALTMPEPNKRLSEVDSDNNEPVVYIDDFEGAQRYIPLGLTASQWTQCSAPVDSSIALSDTMRSDFRAKNFWFQYFIPTTPIKDVYPNKDVPAGRSNLSPLFINFDADMRGIYNKNPLFLDNVNRKFNPSADTTFSAIPENRERIWGGMMRLFSTFNTNFDTENIDYIEIMMRIDKRDVGGGKIQTKMYIDLGQISEDIIPNQRLDTEDGITKDNPIANNIIDAGEDIGIDALNNIAEKKAENYPPPLNLEDDPARDDYSFNFRSDVEDKNANDFNQYNNYEGNSLISEIGQFPDTEILNISNGQTISLDNSYFEYEVILDPYPERNPQIVGGNPDKGWFLYRIPIRKPIRKIGNPLFSNIQYIRIWFKGGDLKATIADWRLVGSQWQRINNFQSVASDDSVMAISFVNREENSGPPNYYRMPPGVKAPRQLNNPDPLEELRLNEQSIAISVSNLRYGEERMATRNFRPLDIFYYKKMKFFIHGDGAMPDKIVKGVIPQGYSFVRFGIDSNNYYEYRTPLTRNWKNVEIHLSQLTAIKQARDSMNIRKRMTYPVPGDPFAVFAVKGNPVLTRVQFFGLGIANPEERYPNELSTTVWIDELRLLDPESSSDWAGLANASIKLADLGTINASFSLTKPNFHRLEERFGDRINTSNWTVAMQGNLDKFAPKSFSGMKIPINYTHSEFLQNPEFVANSDINLIEAAAMAKREAFDRAISSGASVEQAKNAASSKENEVLQFSQTVRILDSWAITGFRLGIPIKHWLINETLNNLTLGYSYSQNFERSPVVSEKFNWIWKLDAKYNVQLGNFLTFQPFKSIDSLFLIDNYEKFKINLLPSSFSASFDMQRSRTTEKSRFLDFPSPVYRDFSAYRQVQFDWKISEYGLLSPSINYNFSTGSTLVPFELDENGRQRSGSEIANKILFNNGFLKLGSDITHSQSTTINFKPNLPIGYIRKYIDISGSYAANYEWNDPLQPDPEIRDAAKRVSNSGNFRINTGIRLRELGDIWFSVPDSKIISKIPDTSSALSGTGIAISILKAIKTIFLDYDKIQLDFNQTTLALNSGVLGETGINNFWTRGITGRESLDEFGPSMAYQMGLVGSPHGSFDMQSASSFPYFRFKTNPGLRPPNSVLPENYNQKSQLKLSTSRPLWKGAVLDLSWNTDFSYNRTQTVETDENGIPTFTNVMATESFNRSYLSIPAIFGWDAFNNNVDQVIGLYNAKKNEIINSGVDTSSVLYNRMLLNALADSFHDGLQAVGLFSGNIGKFMPAVNWGIRWEGIEDWDFWSGVVKNATIEHRYFSKYTENALIDDNGRTTQNQQVTIGFQPLFKLNVGFDEKSLDGLLTASIEFNSTTGYQLNSANRATIASNSTAELRTQISYTMRGFEWDVLGLKLKNDVEGSFTASYQSNSRATYDIIDTESNGEDGRTLDGSSKIMIEPRIRYNLSNRVTAALFFRYDGTFTEGAAEPGFNAVQFGLDIRISIAGGR